MIPVLTNKQAYTIDNYTLTKKKYSSNFLMDNAGKLIAQFILERISDPFNKQFIILSGPGNNGGDAIISHYYLLKYGINSELLLYDDDQFSSTLFNIYKIKSSTIYKYHDSYKFDISNWYLDGLFGIGLNRKIESLYNKTISKLNNCKNIISIDIPSGIDSNTGCSFGNFIKAKYTLSMGFPKIGNYFNDGLNYQGKLYILDIGLVMPGNSIEDVIKLEKADAKNLFPIHNKNIHKYKKGKLISIGGSISYTGAIILAIKASLKVGVGIVKNIIPKSLNSIYEQKLVESISIPLNDNGIGCLSLDNIDDILIECAWADTVLFGPGLICNDNNWMQKILKNINCKLVLDASGFIPLIENDITINDLPKTTIFTPHYGEFSKIFNIDINDLNNDPINIVKNIIPKLNTRILVLKGPTTIIVDSFGKIYIVDIAKNNLATAGSGDVLSGIISGLVAQCDNINMAVILAVFIHSECSDLYYKKNSHCGLLPTQIIDLIPKAMDSIKNVY